MSVQGPLCNGPSLPPPSHFSNCPLSCSHQKLLALMQISLALPSFTCFWASAVSSIWRTLCFSGSLSSSWETPHRYHFSGHFPWPCCVCTAPCTSPYGVWLHSDDRSLSSWDLCSKRGKSVSTVRSCLVSWLMDQVLASDSLDLALGFTTHSNLGLVI